MLTFRDSFITGFIIALFGWGGLFLLFQFTVPTLGPRWLFYFLFLIAVSGTILPVVHYLNIRFPTKPPADGSVILREAILAGIYACVLAWLQLGRTLTLPLGVLLAVGMIIIELFIRLREQSRFRAEALKNE